MNIIIIKQFIDLFSVSAYPETEGPLPEVEHTVPLSYKYIEAPEPWKVKSELRVGVVFLPY